MGLRCMENFTYLSPLRSMHLLYDILRLRLLAILFAPLQFRQFQDDTCDLHLYIQYEAL